MDRGSIAWLELADYRTYVILFLVAAAGIAGVAMCAANQSEVAELAVRSKETKRTSIGAPLHRPTERIQTHEKAR